VISRGIGILTGTETGKIKSAIKVLSWLLRIYAMYIVLTNATQSVI
jgi:hypothetical protein